jgi:hypothetical protein
MPKIKKDGYCAVIKKGDKKVRICKPTQLLSIEKDSSSDSYPSKKKGK